MYATDNKKIARFMLKNPDNFVRGGAFVLTTIQTGLSTCHGQMLDIDVTGASSKYLWGKKRDGYKYLQEHKEVLYAAVKAAVKANDAIGALDVLTNVPNLGMVKAGFLAQMCGLEVSCLDSHNITRLQDIGYDIKPSDLKLPKGIKYATKMTKIAKYVQLTIDTGGSQYWWDSWCAYVAGNRANKALDTAQKVSKYHVTAVMQMA
tara:strand:+ start:12 stop:626 length:615 start_codon:yes stop_codon:yes gene_type:complete